MNIQGAMDFIGNLIKARIDQYVKEQHLVRSFGSPEVDAQVARYIEGLNDSVIGILHWSFDCERYFGVEHARVKRDRIVALMPVDTSKLPAPDSMIIDDASDYETDTETETDGYSPLSGSPFMATRELGPFCQETLTGPYLGFFPPLVQSKLIYIRLLSHRWGSLVLR